MKVIVVGAGPYGCTMARRLHESGHHVLVVERRGEIGGQTADDRLEGLLVCRYGAHIFHTNSTRVWGFMSRFTQWEPYRHYVMARNGDRIFSLPFTLRTMHEVYGTTTPEEVRQRAEGWKREVPNPTNLEEWALSNLGRPFYELLVQSYTEKFWRRSCTELPASILKRIAILDSYRDMYFSDEHEAMPRAGYTALFTEMLKGIDVLTNVDYLANRRTFERQADRIIYTGPVDALCDYEYGPLGYLTVEYAHTRHEQLQQGCPVMNWTGRDVPHARTVEWAYFPPNRFAGVSLVTRETPAEYRVGESVPYYPIRTEQEVARFGQYASAVERLGKYDLGGRLGTYRYYEMGQTVAAAMEHADRYL